MEKGYLNKYFLGVVAKKLSKVETNSNVSHQHEYNAKKPMDKIFGTELPKKEFSSYFLYINDSITFDAVGKMTWYNARYNHPTRTEWRLYFPTTDVSKMAKAGDSLFICKKRDNTLLVIIAEKDSTIESQLYWLFGLKTLDDGKFVSKIDFDLKDEKFEFTVRTVLEQIGIEYEDTSVESYLEPMLRNFQGKFPSTKEFSDYARSTIFDADPINNPDSTLINWINREESLFKLLEEHFINERLKKGFFCDGEIDSDAFIKFSLSVHNRRKSRAGLSLENHIRKLLEENNILYSYTPVTENKSKPDFIFPSIEAYKNKLYSENYLTMLAAKSTCKDRWRQILAEADRIKTKHLLTLESAISENQTNEMIYKNVRLVVPVALHDTYTNSQKKWLYSLKVFFDELKEKQKYYLKKY